MKMRIGVAVALAGLAGFVSAQTAAPAPMTSVSVVQITDMRGQDGYEVMTREEYSKLMKEIKDETAAFAPAVAECKKEWESNKDNKIPFQSARIKPRTAKKASPDFTEREKADKKRAQLEDRGSGKKPEAAVKEKEKKPKSAKAKPEGPSKEELRAKAAEEAFSMISKKMGDKLGRLVPSYGFGPS